MEPTSPRKTFTGVRRSRQTSRRVLLADFFARFFITFGGIGTIIAVLIVCLFLAMVVVPLFLPADVSEPVTVKQFDLRATPSDPLSPRERTDSTAASAERLSQVREEASTSSTIPATSAKVDGAHGQTAQSSGLPVPPTPEALHVAINEYQRLGYAFHADGTLRIFRVDTGKTLHQVKLIEGAAILSHSFANRGGTFVLGLGDGAIRYGRLNFTTRFFDPKKETELDSKVAAAGIVDHQWQADETNAEGELVKVTRHGVVDLIPTGDLRGHTVEWTVEKPRKTAGAVRLIDHVIMADKSPAIVTYADAEKPALQLHFSRIVTNTNTGVDEVRFSRPIEIALKEAFTAPPAFVRVSSTASNVYLTWKDGKTWRYRYNPPGKVEFAEEIDLVEPPDATLTELQFVIGRETLVSGQSDGGIYGWFTVPFDGHTVGWEPIYYKSADQQASPTTFLWVFEQGSPQSRTFHETGDLPGKVVRENAMKGGIALVAADANTIERYLSVIPSDGRKLVRSKEMPGGKSAVTSLAPSSRSRLIAVGFENGNAALYNVTAENRLAHVEPVDGSTGPVEQVIIAPKDDALLVLKAGQMTTWPVDVGHPEASVRTLFSKVWYEGYDEPKHMWQSSSGTDESEPKFGLMPLIYGTLKATFYSMLFAVPLALLAAIYTSEFLKPRLKARIKPTIELMASLPSVVLGFIAAIWLAPKVEEHLAGVLATIITVPVCFLIGAYIWQLLPYAATIRWRQWRFAVMFIFALPIGVTIGLGLLGPWIESSRWFLGDFRTFLNGAKQIPSVGEPIAAWMILLLPVSIVIVALLNGRLVADRFRAAASGWSRQAAATYVFIKFILLLLATLLVTWALAMVFSAVLGDPRVEGSPIGVFDQRNALVIGFIMGFAVIPIIYTIAEDAMSTVPDHLRAASLGAGATHWQTAMRIVIPTAMSGLFSACMIGLGRAVGETMIVLMAAGGTALMDPNIFNGLRSLSANIATELPEAPPASTHYRTLFLAGLVLFVMTFAVNTVAETVRQRFRKRAFQL